MAYGLKYTSDWSDNLEGQFRTNLLKRDYDGAVIEVTSGDNPAILSLMDSSVSNPFHPVRTKKLDIEWISEDGVDFDINELFITDEQEYKVEIQKLEGDQFKTIWTGYLVFTDCKEPYQAKPYAVQMSASCGLALTKDQYFLDRDGRFIEGTMSLFNIIANCLSLANLDLDIHVAIGLIEDGGDNPVMLSQTYIDTDGLRGMKASDVLAGILDSTNAIISQDDNCWVIKGVPEMQAFSVQTYKFDPLGNFISFETVNQNVTMGSSPVSDSIPNIQPMVDVEESLAEPVSIITNTVAPGIPVNRLNNGTFNPAKKPWGTNLAGMTKWKFSQEESGWRVEGEGKPEDPYRFVMVGSIKTTGGMPREGANPDQTYTTIYNTDPILIRNDELTTDKPNIKIKVSGAFRARDGATLLISCRLNDGDRDIVSWLDENGTWYSEKKFKNRANIKVTVDSPHNKDKFTPLREMPLQTFEITSLKIPEYLRRNNAWVAKLYFNIYPITVDGAASFPLVSNNYTPAVSLEDFCVSITTETAYEGEHYYEIDSKKTIRNGEDYEYTSIIADKIDIITSEQRLPENRVMTGYMSVGSFNLSNAWQRRVDSATTGAPEPLQYLSLRERLRFQCGKRRILEGSFFSKDYIPTTRSVINQFDGGYSMITGWNWDIKNCIYNLRLHEIKFEALPEEIIRLKPERGDNGRGNRMYSGASGSNATGNPTSTQDFSPIILDDIPTLYYEVGKLETQIVDLGELILSDHAPVGLEAFVEHYTDWVQNVKIDRGLLEDKLKVIVTAKPLVPGTDRVLIELIDEDGNDLIVIINVIARPATKVTFTLLDGIAVVGKLPGAYPMPDAWDGLANIVGDHNWYQIDTYGGGAAGNAVRISNSQDVFFTTKAIYNFFEAPITSEFGSYRTFVTTSIDNVIVSRHNVAYVLGDEAFLALVKFYLTAGGSDVSEISPSGSNIFADPGAANIKAVISDTEHDKAFISLTKRDETPVDSREFTVTGDPVEDAAYSVFSADKALEVGEYTATIELYLNNETVSLRFVDFAITKAKPAVEGDSLKLVQQVSTGQNFNQLAVLPKTGGSYSLPPNYSVLSDAESEEYDWEGFTFHQLRGGKLIEIDVARYTGTPQYREYAYPITQSDYYIFDTLNSLKIDAIHFDGASQRVVVTRKLGGASGTVSAIFQAEFTFGAAVDLDDVPEDEPGAGLTDYVAGEGLSEYVEDYIKHFNVNVDDETIEIFQPESPDDPTLPGLNHLRVKESGILFEHIQDLPSMTVIGNLTAADGVSYAVEVKEIMEEAELGDLITAIAIKNYITQELENSITGTPGFFPIYDTAHTFQDSIVRQVASKVGFGITPSEVVTVNGNILATGQLKSTIETGVSPLTVASTTLVTNLNADLLDGQHGAYYLNWDNFTNYKSVIAGAGMITGGLLDESVTVDMGTPSTLSNSTVNATTADSHTHAIQTSNLLPGTNVSFSASGVDTILGGNNITIDVAQVPWGIVISRPTTLDGYGITDSLTTSEVTGLLTGKENTFAKGDIIQGAGLFISGATLLNKLVGSDDVTFALATTGVSAGTYRSMTFDVYGRATAGSNPTTLTEYGLNTTVFTKTEVNDILAGYVPESRTITINGNAQDLSGNRTWNVGTITGSGTNGYFPKFTSATALGDSVMRDTGSEINIPSSRSFGVEGPAAMRDYLHVHDYVGIGKSGQHGALVIHSASSATAHPSAAIDVQSTSKGIGFPIMTKAQREAIASPRDGLVVIQSNGSGTSEAGMKFFLGGLWAHIEFNLTDA
jgi:hypothetical protein